MSVQIPPCTEIPGAPTPISIALPGGIKIEAIPPISDGVATEIGTIQNLFSQLGPVLSALGPVFMIVDAIMKIMEVFKAVPDSILKLNVIELLEKISEATKAVLELASLEPNYALPFTIRDTITAIVTNLSVIRSMLVTLQEQVKDAEAMIAKGVALGDLNLQQVGQCKIDQSDIYNAHMAAAMGPLSSVMDVLKILMGFLTSPIPLPEMGDVGGLGIDDMIKLLDTFVESLEAVLEAMPI